MSERTNRLQGLITPKGEAVRPNQEAPARVAPADAEAPPKAPAAADPADADLALVPRPSMGVKSLTLRLPEDEYQRLRAYAYKTNTTHQEVLSKALRAYLPEAEGLSLMRIAGFLFAPVVACWVAPAWALTGN